MGFESFSEIENSCTGKYQCCADVENYFEEYVGDSTANCYGNEVPDVVNEHWIYQNWREDRYL